MKITRRGFVMGCSAAVASFAGSKMNTMAFGDPALNQEILLVLFLRGGMDGLTLVPPIAGADRGHYQAARPNLQIPTSGPGAALNLNGQFGLHPSAAPLLDLYQDGRLSIVQASGMLDVVNKSHFDAMQFVELGTPGQKTQTTGWLARHLASATNQPGEIVIPSLAIGGLQPVSLAGSLDTVNMANPEDFNVSNGPWNWRQAQKNTLQELYSGESSWLHDAGVAAFEAAEIVENNYTTSYTPANGAVYPDTYFGQHLTILAQMIKLDLGLQAATIDVGGWDTHESQGQGSEGYLADLLAELAQGLAAFYTDLDGIGASNYTNRLTVVVQSEFGREVFENGNYGTEHGYGNLMMVLSGNAIGGLHGTWPGLANGQLVDGTDLAVTTDYRQVLGEVLIRRLCNPNLDIIFPGYTGYQPLGIVQGDDLQPPGIMSDGFESGDLSGWSQSVGG